MLEYHAHVAVLRGLRAAIGSALATDPALAARVADLGAAVDVDPDAAILGACIDEIVAHASADGTELQLLEAAANLWVRGRGLYDELTLARRQIESALLDPLAPDAIDLLEAGVSLLDGFRTNVQPIAAEAERLKQTIAPLPHLDAHPRQSDTPSRNWNWRDAFLGRRTDAFVRFVFEGAQTKRGLAFAFGVLSSYAGNTAGSAYLGCVVGGPRRAHRYRDRLARNTVGAWLRDTFATPSATDLAGQLLFRGPTGEIAFPAELAKLTQRAFADAYPSRPAPDLDLGLKRAVRHLQLLDAFHRPPPPVPPPLALAQDAPISGVLGVLSADDAHVPSFTFGTGPDSTPGRPADADSQSSSGAACGGLLALLTLGIALLIYCFGKATIDKKCKVQDFLDEFQGSEEPDPRAPTNITQQELAAVASPEAAAHVVQELFDMQMLLWQTFDSSLAYLTVTGLVYPDDLLMPSPLYQQFLSTPVRSAWPHREETTPAVTYHVDPTSPIEQPAASEAPFPPSQTPASFVIYWSRDQHHSAGNIADSLLRQILRRESDSQNFDLDADRGFRHPCWEVSPGTSIRDAVVSVDSLPYKAE